MIRENKNKDMFKYSNHLGFENPFYVRDEQGSIKICASFEEATTAVAHQIEFDTAAAAGVLAKNHMLGDRTLVRGIRRSPWMAYPDADQKKWIYHKLPRHGHQLLDKKTIAKELFRLLCVEIAGYVADKKKVGILLSGGMDSRIVAGVLQYLIKSNAVDVNSVSGFTWGNHESRDVVYAKEICELFNWTFKHYTVNAEDLWNNIVIAGERGCEYSGFHLHAIPQIANDLDEVDIMLAGSYGDSVGRAEFSGKHVTHLQSLETRIRQNPYFLLKSEYTTSIKEDVKTDLEGYHVKFKRDAAYQYYEMDMQIHYMRRMLNPCMELINERKPLFQVFTKPEVFGYIWGLDPSCRTDYIYKELFNNHLDPRLSNLPWARTGVPYLSSGFKPDGFKKNHHSYPEFVQNQLMPQIEKRLEGHSYLANSIFNSSSVKMLVRLVKKNKGYNFDFLEKLIWLVSFTYFSDLFLIKSNFTSQLNLRNQVNAYFSLPVKYQGLRLYRKILC